MVPKPTSDPSADKPPERGPTPGSLGTLVALLGLVLLHPGVLEASPPSRHRQDCRSTPRVRLLPAAGDIIEHWTEDDSADTDDALVDLTSQFQRQTPAFD